MDEADRKHESSTKRGGFVDEAVIAEETCGRKAQKKGTCQKVATEGATRKWLQNVPSGSGYRMCYQKVVARRWLPEGGCGGIFQKVVAATDCKYSCQVLNKQSPPVYADGDLSLYLCNFCTVYLCM